MEIAQKSYSLRKRTNRQTFTVQPFSRTFKPFLIEELV